MAPRVTHVTQADIARALKAAQAAGLTVAEYTATKDGVRVVTLDGAVKVRARNPWDEVLEDGAPE